MGFWDGLKGFFGKVVIYFRKGAEKFLAEKAKEAAAIAKEMWASGQYRSMHEMAGPLFNRLRREFSEVPDNWIDGLKFIAIEAVKKAIEERRS